MPENLALGLGCREGARFLRLKDDDGCALILADLAGREELDPLPRQPRFLGFPAVELFFLSALVFSNWVARFLKLSRLNSDSSL